MTPRNGPARAGEATVKELEKFSRGEGAGPALEEASRGRVLLVDDDPLVGAAMRRTLAREHDVEVVTSARQALERLGGRAAAYDVVLCDLMMPDMTGMELHAQLMAEAPGLAARMVFVTGGAFTLAAQAFLERVANQRLEKPFEPHVLRALVRARVLQVRAAPPQPAF